MIKALRTGIVAVLLIVLVSATGASTPQLPDIVGHWAEDDVRELVDRGAITGYPDGTYRPEGRITRAEFCSVLRGALGLPEVAGTTFADTFGHWGEGRIQALIDAGVIDTSLYGASYAPEGLITREEIAMMTVRMIGELTGAISIPFADVGTIGLGYHTYVAEAFAQGIITGYPDDTFRPYGSASRAEAAVMAIRALRVMDAAGQVEPSIVSFAVEPESIIQGAVATLSWEVADALVVTISPEIGAVVPSGELAVQPSETTTYTLSATNGAGTTTAETTVTVTPFSGGLLPPPGIIILPPRVESFAADKSLMTVGMSATLSWEVSGVAAVTIEPGIGAVEASGSVTVSPIQTRTYTLTATNVGGTATSTVTIALAAPATIQPGPGNSYDSWVSTVKPDDNYGSAELLWAGSSPNHTSSAYLYFADVLNVNLVPANAVVLAARLDLFTVGTWTDESFLLGAHAVQAAWQANTITWNNQPSYLPEPEDVAAIGPGATWLSWDVTELVRGWVDMTTGNYGVVIRSYAQNNDAGFYSADSTEQPLRRPRLVIEYYVP